MKQIRTACTYDCPDACGLIVEEGGKLKGDPDHPITRGFLCQRIRRHPRRLAHPERLTHPWLRRGGSWSGISWDEALDVAGDHLGEAVERDEPNSVLLVTGGGSLGLSKELIGHFFHSLGPVTTIRGGACGEAGQAAQRLDFGDAACHDYTDLEGASAVVLWGRNPSATGIHLVPFLRAASHRRAPIVLIEARPSETAGLADSVIKVAPSGDGWLALAILRRLMDRGALDERGVSRTENAEEFERWLSQAERSVEQCARKAGVSPEEVDLLADLYASRAPVATLVGWGLQRRASGGRNLRCIDALATLTGNVGVPGGGVNFTSTRRRGLDLSRLAKPTGRTIAAAHFAPQLDGLEPRPSFVYIAGANPVTQLSNSHAVKSALHRSGFVVVADAFFTDTAEAADLILPVALMLEEDDVVGSFQHHHVAKVRKAFEPPRGVRGDPWILSELNRRLGRRPDPLLNDPQIALRSMADPWFPEGESVARNPAHAVTPFEDRFPRPSGKALLITDEPQSVPEVGDAYPLILLTPSCRLWQTSQRYGQDQAEKPLECQVHPEVIGGLGWIGDQASARLVSPVGALDVTIRLEPRLATNECVIRRGGWLRYGQGVNALIECLSTDIGDGVAYYDQRVRLEQS